MAKVTDSANQFIRRKKKNRSIVSTFEPKKPRFKKAHLTDVTPMPEVEFQKAWKEFQILLELTRKKISGEDKCG